MHQFLKLWSIFLTLFLSLSVSARSSEYADFIVENNAGDENFPIKNAVNVLFTEKGMDQIENNLTNLLRNNGVDLSHFAFEKFGYESKKIKTVDLVQDPEMKKLIKSVIDQLENYLDGFDLKDHQFSVNLAGLFVQSEWESINLKIHPFLSPTSEMQQQPNTLFYADLVLKAKNIKFKIHKTTAFDKGNPFLGQIGVNDFELFSKTGSIPWVLKIPMRIYKNLNTNFLAVETLLPETNIKKIMLALKYQSLILPNISIKINDKEFPLKKSKIDELIKNEQDNLLKKFQIMVQENFATMLPKLLDDTLADVLGKGVTEISEMAPPGAPVGSQAAPMYWGINVFNVRTGYKHLLLEFNGLAQDPNATSVPTPIAPQYFARGPLNSTHPLLEKNDIVFAFNIGFFNHFIQLSYQRGYFHSIELGKGEKVQILTNPLLKMDQQGRLKMLVVIGQKVTGIEGWIVKNPVKIAMELVLTLGLNSKTGKAELVAQDIDMDTVSVDLNNFRWPFRQQGVKAVRSKIESSRAGIKGYVLSDDLPVPERLLGLELQKKATNIDSLGYLMVFTDIKM